MLETLDYTIRIGSTPTFLYFDLYLYFAHAAHYVTTFIYNLGINTVFSFQFSPVQVCEWKSRAKQFHNNVQNVSQMFIRLSDTPNRAVLYDLYPYIWDVKEVVLLLDSFINWLGKSTVLAIIRSLRPRPKFEIIWVCESPEIILYNGVLIT